MVLGQDSLADKAGYTSVGVVKGVSAVIVPIALFALAVGFSRRVIRIGNKLGGM
jgi:hypothetical protein